MSNEESTVECYPVDETSDGIRLDIFLATQEPGSTRSQIKKLIEKQLVRIGQQIPKASHLVRAGDQVVIQRPQPIIFPQPEPGKALDVIYEDDDILVLNKPADMTVHPTDEESTGTLVQALLYRSMQFAEAVYDTSSLISRMRPGIVHRLDKNTTGLMVVAKTAEALQNLSGQFKEHAVYKEYTALVLGILSDPTTIHTNIGRKPHRKNLMGVKQGTEGREAITHLEPIRQLYHPTSQLDFTLISCRIETGRTHQIRVHCKYCGHAIIGDPLYTNRQAEKASQLLGAKRQLLHANQLRFRHPSSGEELNFSAPLPEDFQAILTKLQAPDNLAARG